MTKKGEDHNTIEYTVDDDELKNRNGFEVEKICVYLYFKDARILGISTN